MGRKRHQPLSTSEKLAPCLSTRAQIGITVGVLLAGVAGLFVFGTWYVGPANERTSAARTLYTEYGMGIYSIWHEVPLWVQDGDLGPSLLAKRNIQAGEVVAELPRERSVPARSMRKSGHRHLWCKQGISTDATGAP